MLGVDSMNGLLQRLRTDDIRMHPCRLTLWVGGRVVIWSPVAARCLLYSPLFHFLLVLLRPLCLSILQRIFEDSEALFADGVKLSAVHHHHP